jgi:hypothetical protein
LAGKRGKGTKDTLGWCRKQTHGSEVEAMWKNQSSGPLQPAHRWPHVDFAFKQMGWMLTSQEGTKGGLRMGGTMSKNMEHQRCYRRGRAATKMIKR